MEAGVEVNASSSACQVIDGEAVLIHFDSGRYFSSLGTGGEIIRLVELGHSTKRVIAAFEARFPDQGAELGSTIQSFVDELVAEGLFLPVERDLAPSPLEMSLPPDEEFVVPKLESYAELEDLLKLDPIHDVDPAGWPLKSESLSQE